MLSREWKGHDCKRWDKAHCVESVQIRSFSGPDFLVSGLSTDIYYVNLRIQSKHEEIRTKIFRAVAACLESLYKKYFPFEYLKY